MRTRREITVPKLQKANENGGYYVINANAKYNNTTEQYLEYYSGFTTYSYKSSSDAAYVFYFYLIDEGTPSVHIRADESVTENVAQWSGTADYKTAGVTADTGIAGDSLNANDLLDADAIYSAVVMERQWHRIPISTSTSPVRLPIIWEERALEAEAMTMRSL